MSEALNVSMLKCNIFLGNMAVKTHTIFDQSIRTYLIQSADH